MWTAYKNTARGALFLGGESETDYSLTTDRNKALKFGSKEQVLDYIKDFNEATKMVLKEVENIANARFNMMLHNIQQAEKSTIEPE